MHSQPRAHIYPAPTKPAEDIARLQRGGHDAQPETSPRTRALSTAGAVAFVLLAMWAGFVNIGLPPVIIVGGSGVVALVIWRRTYLRSPSDPSIILPVFRHGRAPDDSWHLRDLQAYRQRATSPSRQPVNADVDNPAQLELRHESGIVPGRLVGRAVDRRRKKIHVTAPRARILSRRSFLQGFRVALRDRRVVLEGWLRGVSAGGSDCDG